MKRVKGIIALIMAMFMAAATMLAAPAAWAKAQDICPVMKGNINKNIYSDYQGMRIYHCCPACIDIFKKDPEAYMKKMKEAGIEPEKIPAEEKK
jgi:YHS domain-containing protein